MVQHKDEKFGHNYDGIEEYNNPLPRWWVYLFIATIIWAILYMFYYHFTAIGDSPEEKYAKEMKKYELLNLAKAGTSNEESTAKASLNVMTDKADLEAGKSIFVKNCTACHGQNGEGSIGPNLTDDYWIHGNTYKDIVTTITNGVPEKGMITWKNVLQDKEILQVASFVYSLHGTNPSNPKAPQGTLYKY